MKFSKLYFEKYAQLTLPLAGFIDKFELSDKPDLQSIESSIGIKVVNVESKEEGIFRNLWNKYSGKGLTSNEFNNKLENNKLKKRVVPDCEYMMAEISSGDAKELIKTVIETIQRKSNKFSDYKHFNRNGLYLYTRLWEEQLKDLQNIIMQNNFVFDFYIINLLNKIALLTKTSIKTYDITDEQLKILKQDALNYEN